MTESSETGVIRLHNVDEFVEHTAEMMANSIRLVTVLSTDLEREWLGAQPVCDALRRFSIGNRRSQVRILTTDPTPAIKGGHPWLELIRRLSRVECHIINAEILDREPLKGTFILSDRSGIVYRGTEVGFEGFAHYDDRATVRQQLDVFDQYWRYSDISPEFRTLAL